MIVISVAGFGPSLIDQSRRNAAPTPLVIAHGIVAGAWLLLFLTQASLIATKRIAIHRRLGMTGPVLGVMLIGVGYLMLIDGARRGYELSGDLSRALAPPDSPPFTGADLAAGMVFPLAGFVSFALLSCAGLLYRRRPEIHKRLMVLALVPLANEPITHLLGYLAGHWPTLQGTAVFLLPIQLLLLFGTAVHDKLSAGRVHPVSLWVPFAFLAWLIGINVIVFPSGIWHELARRLVE